MSQQGFSPVINMHFLSEANKINKETAKINK